MNTPLAFLDGQVLQLRARNAGKRSRALQSPVLQVIILTGSSRKVGTRHKFCVVERALGVAGNLRAAERLVLVPTDPIPPPYKWARIISGPFSFGVSPEKCGEWCGLSQSALEIFEFFLKIRLRFNCFLPNFDRTGLRRFIY